MAAWFALPFIVAHKSPASCDRVLTSLETRRKLTEKGEQARTEH